MSGRDRVIVVLPAYNAARTLERTCHEIPPGAADEVILV
ncbi:MAG TPA: glycosyltransferase family 2 protein, partial [Candidatus Polarisedimenticolia bacterium]|nr:glycosyltransferase family 2 protein [Candidatus Polarisedimenticolia bacterium]